MILSAVWKPSECDFAMVFVSWFRPSILSFAACSFWLADAYLMLGRREEALHLFNYLLSLRNDVGLLSEDYEPRSGRLVGNFPQAFSHLALVNTASNLAHYQKPAEQRAEHRVVDKPSMQPEKPEVY